MRGFICITVFLGCWRIPAVFESAFLLALLSLPGIRAGHGV